MEVDGSSVIVIRKSFIAAHRPLISFPPPRYVTAGKITVLAYLDGWIEKKSGPTIGLLELLYHISLYCEIFLHYSDVCFKRFITTKKHT